jgi:hypothetical protein
MSAFVCHPDHFKALAVFAASRVGGYGSAHLAVDPQYVKGLPAALLQLSGADLADVYANILYAENIRSCHARYPGDTLSGLPGICYKPARVEVTGHDMLRASYRLPAVAILKMCDCLEYQSCETEDYRQTVAWDLLSKIRSAAWHRLPGYEDAPWDYITPETRAEWAAENTRLAATVMP